MTKKRFEESLMAAKKDASDSYLNGQITKGELITAQLKILELAVSAGLVKDED